MSTVKKPRKPITRIEDSKLWQTVSKIARDAYNLHASISDDHWTLRSRFEANAFDVTNDVAEACGNLDPRDVKYSLSRARKDLFSLKNAYSLAFRIGILEVEPEIMVTIDQAVKLLDQEVKALDDDFQLWHDEMTHYKVAPS